ncbi:MAG TPA: spore coat U domain-containing protein [Candidatus Rubrimentiphilum sp.]|nr:spore coat U domain-containing protein [Candidatus Rubrimentiphilum sp.]
MVIPRTVDAGSSTGTLTVTASVAQKCILSSPTLAFGSYDPVVTNNSANLDATTTITVTCTKGATGITLGFGNSANAPTGCAAPQRCLVGAVHSNYLNYQLYSDSGHSSVWTTAISESVTGGITTPTSVTIYGRVPPTQDVNVDTYSDTVVATVNY